jgi:hypothetical protein
MISLLIAVTGGACQTLDPYGTFSVPDVDIYYEANVVSGSPVGNVEPNNLKERFGLVANPVVLIFDETSDGFDKSFRIQYSAYRASVGDYLKKAVFDTLSPNFADLKIWEGGTAQTSGGAVIAIHFEDPHVSVRCVGRRISGSGGSVAPGIVPNCPGQASGRMLLQAMYNGKTVYKGLAAGGAETSGIANMFGGAGQSDSGPPYSIRSAVEKLMSKLTQGHLPNLLQSLQHTLAGKGPSSG